MKTKLKDEMPIDLAKDKSPVGDMSDMERSSDNVEEPTNDDSDNPAIGYINECSDPAELHSIISAANTKLQELTTTEENKEGEPENANS